MLKALSKHIIGCEREKEWEVAVYKNTEGANKYLDDFKQLDVMYLDVTLENAITLAEQVRRKNRQAAILLIADAQVSPMLYIKPTIMASSLLVRPFSGNEAKHALQELYAHILNKEEKRESITIIDRQEKKKIPIHKIYYFEARQKKIYICIENQEYEFYDTLNNIEKRLPQYFFRCHRSFLVNQRKIANVYLAKHEIMLENQSYIPFSRNCQNRLREIQKAIKKLNMYI